MQDLTVHIELDHDFYADSYEESLAEFILIANDELIELPELFA